MSVTRSSPVVTKWVTIMSVLMGQSPIETVPACPIQIGAHHHIDVYTDINHNRNLSKLRKLAIGTLQQTF